MKGFILHLSPESQLLILWDDIRYIAIL